MTTRVVMSQRTWERRWAEMAEIVEAMAGRGPELIRLAQMSAVPDGYGAGGSGTIQSTDVADPTLRTAARRNGWRLDGKDDDEPDGPPWVPNDRVNEWLDELFLQVTQAAARLRRIHQLDYLVEHRGDGRVGRQVTGGECLCCERYVSGSASDRLRSGLCETCRKAYDRWKEGRHDVSVGTFCRWARRTSDAEGAA